MNSDKVIYWVLLAAFALGLSHAYRDGRFPTAHRVLAHAESTLCPLVTRAERTLALAKLIVHPAVVPTKMDDWHDSMADFGQEQAELLRDQAQEQAELVREQVQAQAEVWRARNELRRAQIEQMRHMTESQFHFSQTADRRILLVCPKTGTRVSVNVNPPDVEVSDNF